MIEKGRTLNGEIIRLSEKARKYKFVLAHIYSKLAVGDDEKSMLRK